MFRRNMLAPSSGLKYVGSGIGFIRPTQEQVHGTHSWGPRRRGTGRNPLLGSHQYHICNFPTSLQQSIFMHLYISTLMMEASCSFETLISSQKTTRCQTLGYNTSENLKTNSWPILKRTQNSEILAVNVSVLQRMKCVSTLQCLWLYPLGVYRRQFPYFNHS
jgi:hypothetical protein